MHNLKILDARLVDSSMEIENVRLGFMVPLRRLVLQHNEILGFVCLKLFHNGLLLNYRLNINSSSVLVHSRYHHGHLAWTTQSEYVGQLHKVNKDLNSYASYIDNGGQLTPRNV